MESINRLEKEIADLRKILVGKENELYELKKKWVSKPHLDSQLQVNSNVQNQIQLDRLPRWAIERYSRQILLPEIGVEGQVKLCAARVLIVGAGGLGCPAAVYLAGAGIGEIGLLDYDTVDLTNIHRQFLHTENDEHQSKVQSAADALRRINSNITINQHNCQLDSSNALSIVSKYDVVLDCSDNVPTRYLLNDACVLTKLPLISGSALKMEGQLTMYGYRDSNNPVEKDPAAVGYLGPCYRCVFPAPPPPDAVGSCSAHGVAGPVPGLIGALQALEAIKLLVGVAREKLLLERMLIFDGEDATFRTVRLRGRNPECAACSDTPTITRLLDYETFCKAKAKEKDLDLQILSPSHRISATDLSALMSRERPLLVDVRSAPEFRMCRIDGAVNYPIETLRGETMEQLLGKIREYNGQVTFVCRRGNDSQLATQRVLAALRPAVAAARVNDLTTRVNDLTTRVNDLTTRVNDLAGGLHAWAKHVDNNFPVY